MFAALRTARQELSGRQIVKDGSLLSGLLSLLILGSLYYNAAIWQGDYPPAIQAQAGPVTARTRHERTILAVPLLLIMLGMPCWSNLGLKRRNGGQLSFLAAWLNAYAVGQVFNLFDFVVLDYLVFVRWQPGFVILPGTQGMPAYRDAGFHFRASVKGVVYAAVPSLVVAWLTTRGAARPRKIPAMSGERPGEPGGMGGAVNGPGLWSAAGRGSRRSRSPSRGRAAALAGALGGFRCAAYRGAAHR